MKFQVIKLIKDINQYIKQHCSSREEETDFLVISEPTITPAEAERLKKLIKEAFPEDPPAKKP